MSKRLYILIVFLIFISGCNSMQSVTRNYNYTNEWKAQASMLWDSNGYVFKIKLNYEGNMPLKKVEIKPMFNGEFWPHGYNHPNITIYTWESERDMGEMPMSEDLSKSISKKASTGKVMSIKEAEEILMTTEIQIKWVDSKGEEHSAKLN